MDSANKSAVVVLTRGYERNEDYARLIKRNKSIARKLRNKEGCDLVFFHEGNITDSQQEFIRGKTPSLRMKFVDIHQKGLAFRKDKETIEQAADARGPYSYRHMCSFWFVDFWHYVEEYDYIARIDDDCIMLSSVDSIFTNLKKVVVSCAAWGAHGIDDPDLPHVTQGLNDFTLDFLGLDNSKARPQIPPYTNLINFNVKELRKNQRLSDYIAAIDRSEGIYRYRWGDHVLWGEALSYLYGPTDHLIDKSIVYLHGSHRVYVNSWRNRFPTWIKRRMKWQPIGGPESAA